MKHLQLIRIACFVALSGAMAGCMRDRIDDNAGPKRTEAVIRLAGQTRGGSDDSDPDNVIGTFRIMAFRSGSSLACNRTVDFSQNDTYTLTINTGTYDFVFIANEHSDTSLRGGKTLTEIMDGYTAEHTDDIIDDLWFSSSAFTVGKAIPMAAVYKGVKVNSDNTVTLPAPSGAKVSLWEVSVERLAVRVDLTLETATEAVADSYTGLTVVNVPDKVWISPSGSGGSPNYNDGSYESASSVAPYRSFGSDEGDIYALIGETETFTGSSDPVVFEKGGDDVWRWHKRLILPASEFSDPDDASKAIVLRAGVSGQTLVSPIGSESNGYTAARNHRYRMVGTLAPGKPVVFTITVTDWGANNRVTVGNNGNPDNYEPDYHYGWAASNIYWDPELNEGAGGLTFTTGTSNADENPRIDETYQGVYFKWGSLIGISPKGNYIAGTTKLYFPEDYLQSNDKTVFTWNEIPSVSYSRNSMTDNDGKRAYLMEIHDPSKGIGDICRYLSGKPGVPEGQWRMPFRNEGLFLSDFSARLTIAPQGASSTIDNNDIGTASIPYGFRVVASDPDRPDLGTPFFPRNGMRNAGSYGNLYNVGSNLYVWSSSGTDTYGTGNAFTYSGNELFTYNYATSKGSRHGSAVRCVRATPAPDSRTLSTDSDGKFFVADGGTKTITVTSDAKWIASLKRGTNAVTEGDAAAMGGKLITAFDGGVLNGHITKGASGTGTTNTLTLTAADFTSPYSDARGDLVIVFRDAETGLVLHETTVTIGTMFDLRSQEDNPYELHFPAIGGTAIINVLDETGASGSWSLSGLSLSAYSGTGSRTITVTVSNNPKAETVTSYITLSRSGMPNRQITVYQDMPYLPEPHTGWAGSNIYWDNVNKRLTFDDMAGDGTEGPQSPNEQIQGVHFMWGSLTAISPMGDYDPETSILYSPKLGANDGTNYNMDWSDIVYVSQLYSTNTAIVYDRALLYELHDPGNEVGDICKYITDKGWAPGAESGVKWRMPVGNEMSPNTLFNRVPSDGSYTTFPSDNPYGLTTVPSGYRISDGKGNAFFPMTGNRYQDRVDPCGWKGHYYTSSGSTTGIFCQMAMSIIWTNQTFESGAYPVRCVRE